MEVGTRKISHADHRKNKITLQVSINIKNKSNARPTKENNP